MHANRSQLASLLVVLGLLLAGRPLAAQAPASITGRVENRTPGGAIPASASVNLHLYELGAPVDLYTTTLGTDGTFSFPAPEGAAGLQVYASLEYQGVHYRSATYDLAEPLDGLVIDIYESTDDPAAVEIEQVHIFIAPFDDRVRIAELYHLSNRGERSYIGRPDPQTGVRSTLAIALPSGAEGLSLAGASLGERYVGDGASFVDTQPVLPGAGVQEIEFSYELALSLDRVITRAFALPVTSVVLLVRSESLGLDGPDIIPLGFMSTQMGSVATYQAGPFAAGEALSFSFSVQTLEAPPSGVPAAAAGSPGIGSLEVLGGLLVLGVAVWLILRARPRSRSLPPVPEEAQPIIAAIAELDHRFAAGEMQEAAFRQERERLKEALRKRIRHD